MDMSHNDRFAKAVSLFLAEGLRTRAIDKRRAAEIAEKVLANLNLLDTEEHFLRLVRELARDFEELKSLEGQLERKLEQAKTRNLENSIRDYAIQALQSDPREALEILKAAGEPGLSQASIYVAFPKFKEYHERTK